MTARKMAGGISQTAPEVFTVLRVLITYDRVVEIFAQGDDGPDDAIAWAVDRLRSGLPIAGQRSDREYVGESVNVAIPAERVILVEAYEISRATLDRRFAGRASDEEPF